MPKNSDKLHDEGKKSSGIFSRVEMSTLEIRRVSTWPRRVRTHVRIPLSRGPPRIKENSAMSYGK